MNLIDKEHVRHLVDQYEASLPRYTSYPTVPFWQGLESMQQKKLIIDSAQQGKDLSLYIHIPFCEYRCHFCGCNTIISQDKSRADHYLDLLNQEITQFSDLWHKHSPGALVKQIHFGGGTPTFLTTEQTKRLNKILNENFYINFQQTEVEFSVEIDPQATTPEHLHLLQEMGVNRLSFGVQDFDETLLQALNRPQSSKWLERLYRESRSLNFDGINMDLMYGLPGQTPQNYSYTLEQTLEFAPDRIAIFSYAHVPWMKPHQKALEKIGILSGYDKFQLFIMALEKLTENGYRYIGLDHFARKGDPLTIAQDSGKLHRNFQGYTTMSDLDILAFGISAISSTSHAYWQNPKDLASYEKALKSPPFLAIKGHRNSQEDLRRHKLMVDILCYGLYQGGQDQQKDLVYLPNRLTNFYEDNLITPRKDGFALTVYGQLFSRNIASLFDDYLAHKQNSEQKVFSKSV